jgi:hypothetical protein
VDLPKFHGEIRNLGHGMPWIKKPDSKFSIFSVIKKKLNQVSWKNFGKNYNTSSRKGHQVMFAHQIHQF